MYIKARVTPDSKKDSLVRESADVFTIAVRAPAERNLANAAVRALLVGFFNIPLGKVRLIAGHRSRSKIFDVEV